MRLNGRQRIGIVASIAWIFGAGIHTLNAEQERNNHTYFSLINSCVASYKSNSDQTIDADDICTKKWADFNVSALHEEREAALTAALVPVPLAWGLAYFILFLIRWIRRGGFETRL
jgi:hypothetical protein